MIKMSLEEIEQKLQLNNIMYEKRPIAHGVNIHFANNTILQVFTNGKVYFTGKKDISFIDKIKNILYINSDFINSSQQVKIKIDLINQIKDFFIEEDEDGDYTITQDACDIAEYLDELLKKLEEQINE